MLTQQQKDNSCCDHVIDNKKIANEGRVNDYYFGFEDELEINHSSFESDSWNVAVSLMIRQLADQLH